jgi:hypothetical protein
MDFENSPPLNYSKKPPRSFKRWLEKNRRIILAIIVVLIVSLLTAVFLMIAPTLHPQPPGGLEACLLTPGGKPVVTTVKIATFSRTTGLNGCFFFPSIPPGDYQLIISTTSRDVTVPIKIISNEAVDLESITIDP